VDRTDRVIAAHPGRLAHLGPHGRAVRLRQLDEPLRVGTDNGDCALGGDGTPGPQATACCGGRVLAADVGRVGPVRRVGGWALPGQRVTTGVLNAADLPGWRWLRTRSGRYLSSLERERIAVLLRGEIARRLVRAPSTISRELRRSMRDGDHGVHDACLAHARSREQARRQRRSIFSRDRVLRALVQDKLQLEWGPEQIAAWLRPQDPGRRDWHICHETIYQGVYLVEVVD